MRQLKAGKSEQANPFMNIKLVEKFNVEAKENSYYHENPKQRGKKLRRKFNHHPRQSLADPYNVNDSQMYPKRQVLSERDQNLDSHESSSRNHGVPVHQEKKASTKKMKKPCKCVVPSSDYSQEYPFRCVEEVQISSRRSL